MDCNNARPPCLLPTPGVYSYSCPLNWWCHPTISSSVVPFSSCLQSFPASGSFLEEMSQFFTSGSQSIGVSPSASVLPMNIQDWVPLGWTGWISLQSKGLSRVFSITTGPEWAIGISPCTPPTSGPYLMLFPLPILGTLHTFLPLFQKVPCPFRGTLWTWPAYPSEPSSVHFSPLPQVGCICD